MKHILFIFFIFSSCKGQAQNDQYLRPATLGVLLFQNDLSFGSFQKGNAGLGISYQRGIHSNLDLFSGLSGSSPDSISKRATGGNNKAFLFNLDLGLRVRVIHRPASLQPFFHAGTGAHTYKKRIGGYAFGGLGFEWNIRDIYIIPSLQYRVSFAGDIINHYNYSILVSGLLGRSSKGRKENHLPAEIKTIIRDRDGDGIADPSDLCPDHPGLAVYQGCPDTDSDGIPDVKDKCPKIAGYLRYEGCPIPDTDNDGINDEKDSCIDEKGIEKYNGCPVPDTDSDGLNDEIDSCITVFGPIDNSGCPFIDGQLNERIGFAAKNIFFKTGSAELLRCSNPFLDTVETILRQNFDLKLNIEGHTDASGAKEVNQVLSEKRAATVANYLIRKGIAASRISIEGYGESLPVSSNSTPVGRSKNRRVELKLRY